MPHKRAKAAKRAEHKTKLGHDAPPKQDDGINKKQNRILQAEAAHRKRSRPDEESKRPAKKVKKVRRAHRDEALTKKTASSLSIKPHESLKTFGQRVESALQPGIASTAKIERGLARARAKREKEERDAKHAAKRKKPVVEVEPEPEVEVEEKSERDWAAASRLRLNDIADAPPILQTKLKAVTNPEERIPASRLPIAPSQREAIARERAFAIQRQAASITASSELHRYREMKAARLAAADEP